MDGSQTVRQKSLAFGVRIIDLYRHICDTTHMYEIGKQILRSGTSIGANIAEASCAISKKDFLAKMYISYKECSETLFWLDLMYNSDILKEHEYRSLYADCEEMRKMLSSITYTTRKNLENEEKSKAQ